MAGRIKFIEIELPLINEVVSIIDRPQNQFEGKSIKIDMTRKLRGKNLEIIFRLSSDKDKIKADVERLRIFKFFIRKIMRKGTSYIEDSFDVKCKDAKLKVKPMLITRQKVHRSVRNALRKTCKQEITTYFSDKTKQEIFEELLSEQFQRKLSKALKKIYPLSFCEIIDIYSKK
jgi:ribosomal protein S3AE